MRKQVTDSVLLVRPSVFRKNEQTAVNNFFQKDIENLSGEDVNREAQGEFDALVNELKSHGILVTVIQDDEKSESPDSIFPNNIVSFH
ncbi:MAG: arginine deiminase-related protein, partial [Sphingobacterium sp.]